MVSPNQVPSNPNAPTESPFVRQAVVEVVPIIMAQRDSQALYTTDEGGGKGQWVDYFVQNHYPKDGNTYMAGLTSPTPFQGGSVAFFQLATPTLLWICDWTASRYGAQPKIPSEVPADPGWVLLAVIPTTSMITVDGGGKKPLYRISGIYVYGHQNPADSVFKNVSYPLAPWLKDVFPNGRTQPQNTLTKNLVDTPAATQNTGGSPVQTRTL